MYQLFVVPALGASRVIYTYHYPCMIYLHGLPTPRAGLDKIWLYMSMHNAHLDMHIQVCISIYNYMRICIIHI